jgi:Ca2+-binding RTX toxin-like protein
MLGGAWSGTSVTYSFLAGDMNRNGIADFDEGDWKAFYREILDSVESFADVTFEAVSGRANINFRLDEGGGGESGVPVAGTRDVEMAVGINPDVAGSAAVVRLGTYSVTWFHEMGHALGLKHTHDAIGSVFPKLPGIDAPGDKGPTYLNSQLNSVMGYTSPFLAEDNPFTPQIDPGTAVNAQPGSFGAIDIAALQHLYGARAHNTGNTVYRFTDDVDANRGYTTIWDTGGRDTIQYAGPGRAKIDLRAATLENEIGGGGWISTSETLTGGYTIAHGVVIENATGNTGDDILIGNGADNSLRGLGGDDRLDGGAGNDSLDGGAGMDRAVYRESFASYTIRHDGARTMITGDGVDRLWSVELAVFSDGVYDINRRVFQPNTATERNLVSGDAASNVLVALTGAPWTLKGRSGDDTLIGNDGNDLIFAGSGNDDLSGGGGQDRMIGGSGHDRYTVDNVHDVVVEAADGGTDRVDATVSFTLSDNVEALALLGSEAIDGTGNALGNGITGNDAGNTLMGLGGNDRLDGRGGNDRLIGGAGIDSLSGGGGSDVFVFGKGDTGATRSTADRILDFEAGDRIDLSALRSTDGSHLTFIGGGPFTGAEGDVRAYRVGGSTYVESDLDGDRMADLVIKVIGAHAFAGHDFLL